MNVKQVIVTALVLWLFVVCAAATRAQTPPSIPIGPGLTEDKPHSKLWETDNADRTVTWWGILGFVGDANAAPGVYFYKLENGVLVRQTFPGAHLVGVDIYARGDVLWNDHDLHLFVLMYKGEDTTLHKYTYDASTQTYTRLAGFPVAIPLLAGSETATIAQDSTGQLWLAHFSKVPLFPPPLPLSGAEPARSSERNPCAVVGRPYHLGCDEQPGGPAVARLRRRPGGPSGSDL